MKPVMTEITSNPCKMCMPMGAAMAFMGIEGCSVLLHGSQGCSTYMRRHMATHFNEPVDIASSSLTEEGTVYGGEKNLFLGLDNLVKVYQPQVIGLASTCLAETIGEDLGRLSKEYGESREAVVPVIPVSTPGYAGTQFEGYAKTLLAIVKTLIPLPDDYQIQTDASLPISSRLVNLITGPVSPADARWLKDIVQCFGLKVILLPDISTTLDGGKGQTGLSRRTSGTPLDAIRSMNRAICTIELMHFIDQDGSPGQFLQDAFGVPLHRLNLPVGLRDTDAFLGKLAELAGFMPTSLVEARARYADAMIDSHKYNARGRAVIFGEPDFVFGQVRMCCELGVFPVVAATGSRNPAFVEACQAEVGLLAKQMMVGQYIVLDHADFVEIENLAIDFGANLLIGSSDGRRIEEETKIPLIRSTFPVHDRMGGQRIQLLGYEGSIEQADKITNELLAKLEGGFREIVKNAHLRPDTVANRQIESASQKTQTHPCFTSGAACSKGRIHLPVAPACNIQCNYCVRSFDCPNESRPGVTTRILDPEQAVQRYLLAREKMPDLAVVGIAGPGDALANFDEVALTLSRIRLIDPDVLFCLSTNGLMLPFYADRLIELGVSHLTITINAIDPEIGARIYHHVDYLGERLTGVEAARTLIHNQLSGLKYLTSKGVVVKVNTVLIKGINDEHIDVVIQKVKALGCTISNIMQMIPVAGSAFGHLPQVSTKDLNGIRRRCGQYVQQMYHCQQCRADAVGLLGQDISRSFNMPLSADDKPESEIPVANAIKPDISCRRVAVFSQSGWLVDQHFGKAHDASIYEIRAGIPVLIEKRSLTQYCQGETDCDPAESRISHMIQSLQDCQTILAVRIGDKPMAQLQARGIQVITTYEPILEALQKLA